MLARVRALALALALAACGASTPARPAPHHEPEAAAVSTPLRLTIAERWLGPIAVDATQPPLHAWLVRDDAAYDALVERLPTHRVQMKQPAPPSEDPLRARPPIDFATEMLVVVARTDTLEPPVVGGVSVDGARLRIHVAAPTPPPAARPTGIGGYVALRVPRTPGEPALAEAPLFTEASEAALATALGQFVQLRGELSATRRPTLLGVDVDVRDDTGEVLAIGWLASTTVTAADLDPAQHGGEIAHRGTGTFFYLVAPDGNGLAVARRAW